ncbi:hypothetical protein EC973_005099 [Apophysomyces ossiformis]|uniref:SGTA homodimerisation domain-containing protein n=1 Tax=Apophysomyces ossiformis TaxID=679940 RepID=A0A8H7BJV3_9FUNG|nr:hypothetical protein EC973_005099 [Apophysomyces ossiformis]
MASENKKALVFSVLEFLKKSCEDGTISQDDQEGIEVAMQCIGEAFGVDPTDKAQQEAYSTKPANLLSIFEVYLKTKSKSKAQSAPVELSEEDKAKAEELKAAGNRKVAERNYPEAIKLYTEAITINGTQAVYYANRAAAYSQQGDHQKAVDDAKKAIEIDPNYVKSYSRMGHALFCQSKYQEAVDAYEKGLQLDPENNTIKSALATARSKLESSSIERSMPQESAGGAGGMPDLSSILSNPAMMGMAQQMMQSGAFEGLMNNPNIARMAQQMMSGGGGGLAEMMRNPEMMEIYAKSFHDPGSGGPLNLPFQRPIEACRQFTSHVINEVIDKVASKMANLDLARLFTNAFPNTLDTTIQKTTCLNGTSCNPLSFIITGDINAMWLRDSANQLLPYLNYIKQDMGLKRLFLGAIYMQAHFINIDPYANAFNEPDSLSQLAGTVTKRNVPLKPGVYERKWEIDSLASFLGLSYQYWHTTGDNSFAQSSVWIQAVENIIHTLQKEQQPTFDPVTGKPLNTDYVFSQTADRPTETQFLDGRGNPVKSTGMVKSLFRPSDDATLFTFFVPGNAMMSVELAHLAELLEQKKPDLAAVAKQMSADIRKAIYDHAVIDHPQFGKLFAYEVDGYGSYLIMDDANVPSLLSLSMIGFLDQNDTIYQNTRRLVFSKANPYYFSGPRASGIGGPHIISSSNDTEIREALDIILNSTDNTGLIHESVNVYNEDNGINMNPEWLDISITYVLDNAKYTRSWFAWANGLFGQAILKLAQERPHLIFKQ